jgi:hypothetical protein
MGWIHRNLETQGDRLTVVTVFNFCVPSTLLAWWEGRHQARGEVVSA